MDVQWKIYSLVCLRRSEFITTLTEESAIAAAAMALSSVSVIANAARLRHAEL